MKYCWIFITLLFASMLVNAQQVVYVQSAKAKLLNKPSFKAQLVTTLKKGDQITVIEEMGRWVKVDYQSTKGWISKLLIAKQPPIKKVSVLQGKHEELEKSARRRASTNDAAATRGLRDEDRTRISDIGHPDYEELKNVESIDIQEKEVLEFHHTVTTE